MSTDIDQDDYSCLEFIRILEAREEREQRVARSKKSPNS
ncbi:MAG: hypothetical protein GQF41_0227 [Candidatus Rifleibacterium amylolyticum]|nr:MAG: hypothetical protein GQF41_0227 [Candidatus Rifleibacterium amylolyticum]